METSVAFGRRFSAVTWLAEIRLFSMGKATDFNLHAGSDCCRWEGGNGESTSRRRIACVQTQTGTTSIDW